MTSAPSSPGSEVSGSPAAEREDGDANTTNAGPDPIATEISADQSNDPSPPLSTEFTTALVTDLSTDPPTTELITAPASKAKKLVRRKRRPARPQIDASAIKSEPPPQTGTIFNIWYNKWSGGDREDKYLSQTAAPGRCHVKQDSGYTRADKIPGSYFCIFFAKGLCPKGRECEYLHRLPGIHDHFNPNVDCFGRDKHSDYRDDMGGVGSFMRQNRTLYVGRIHVTDGIEEVVARHFAEWGDVERIRVLTARGVAFVTYAHEATSQFAKEAMAHQSLDNGEILNVRWATMDPNPLAHKREVRRIEEQAAEAVRRALPEEFVREIEGDGEAKRRRKELGGFGLPGYEAPDDVWYAQAKMITDGATTSTKDEEHGQPMMHDELMGVEERHEPEAGGILSRATLTALKGHTAQVGGSRSGNLASTAGPLVGYGSEDDSD